MKDKKESAISTPVIEWQHTPDMIYWKHKCGQIFKASEPVTAPPPQCPKCHKKYIVWGRNYTGRGHNSGLNKFKDSL